jgi:Arc/MetJ-type ribon-helix-helix transcriptional regulator
MPRRKTSVSLDEDTLKWISEKIKEKKFRSVSHAVEYALEKLRKEEG